MVQFSSRGFGGGLHTGCSSPNRSFARFPGSPHSSTHWIYRLEVHSGKLPYYAPAQALPFFTLTDSVIWLRVRRFCKRIVEDIEWERGQASFTRYEAQKCSYCKRWMIGAEAETWRRNLDWVAMNPWEEMPRCGDLCQ